MEEKKKHRRYGLLGKDIGYSFSRGYFTEKFEKLKIKNSQTDLIDSSSIVSFEKELKGLISEIMDPKINFKDSEA